MAEAPWIAADWPAPAHVRAGTTTRHGGQSAKPYAGLNLAAHVGDRPAAVAANRRLLRQTLQLPAEPAWLHQVHGSRIVHADARGTGPADGSWTRTAGTVCAVLTADCLPLLLCDRHGSCIAAVHVGWRGLVARIVQAAVTCLPAAPAELLAWLGPCIGASAFEVGDEVYTACQQNLPGAETAFRSGRPGRWWADLPALTRLALDRAGVAACYPSGLCTHADAERFYSYRRDGHTGRMASLIWMDG